MEQGGGCLPALVLPWIAGPLLATTLWVGHIVHALMLLPHLWEGGSAAGSPVWPGRRLECSGCQPQTGPGLPRTVVHAVGSRGDAASQPPPLASQPPPLAVPEAQESGPGCAHEGPSVGQLVWRCVPGLGISLSLP